MQVLKDEAWGSRYLGKLRRIAAAGPLRSGSRLRVCELLVIQAVLRPRRWFTCAEFQDYWGVTSPSSVWRSAMALESRGLLEVERKVGRDGGRGSGPHRYRAGPELVAIIALLKED